MLQYCCTVRGTYDVGGLSFTRCDGAVQASSGFFFDADAGLTYEACYGSREPGTCVDQPEGPVEGPAAEGHLTAAAFADEAASRRTYAIIQPAFKEGAWRLLVQDGGHAGWYYCTGRGTVSATNTCRMNACNIQTPHYVTIGPAIPGGDCYHTCYRDVLVESIDVA